MNGKHWVDLVIGKNRINPWIPVGLEEDGSGILHYAIYDLQDYVQRDVTFEEWSTFKELLRNEVNARYGQGAFRTTELEVIRIEWDEVLPWKPLYEWWGFRDHFFYIVGRLLTTEKDKWMEK